MTIVINKNDDLSSKGDRCVLSGNPVEVPYMTWMMRDGREVFINASSMETLGTSGWGFLKDVVDLMHLAHVRRKKDKVMVVDTNTVSVLR